MIWGVYVRGCAARVKWVLRGVQGVEGVFV